MYIIIVRKLVDLKEIIFCPFYCFVYDVVFYHILFTSRLLTISTIHLKIKKN